MSSESRVAKSQHNLVASFVNNVVVTLLGFATRTVFVYSLGVEYLGLNGLFTNVLSLLSLAELGVGSAITFSLYKPIAQNDQNKIQALMGLYKKAYQFIGWVILGLGVLITPILKYVVNLDSTVQINYYLIYFMFLFNTVISYWFFAYRSVIIYAHQEGYVLTRIETVFSLVKAIVQFGILIILKNYYIYLAVPILFGIVKNVIISNIAGKRYPFIDEKVKEPLRKDERKEIFKNIYALSLFKISGVVYGATDNVIISSFLGTRLVGLLSNYTMIIQLVTTYVNMVFQSLYASIGNLNATENKDYKYVVYKRLDLLNYWIYSYCAVCLGCFLNPCISVWFGGAYCLSNVTIILLAVVFYVPGLNNVINIYKDACGLFKEVQYRALATAIVNLIVSIFLVLWIGLDGVFIGTIVAYLTTIYIVDPRVVFNKVFECSSKQFYISLLKKTGIILPVFGLSKLLVSYIKINNWFSLILSFIVLSILLNGLFVVMHRKTEEFVYLKGLVRQITYKIIKKRNYEK